MSAVDAAVDVADAHGLRCDKPVVLGEACDLGLNPSTTYGYNVQALDAAGNPSNPSERKEAMTGPE